MACTAVALRPFTRLPPQLQLSVCATAAPLYFSLFRCTNPLPRACSLLHRSTVLAATGEKGRDAELALRSSPNIARKRRPMFRLRLRSRLRIWRYRLQRLSILGVVRNAARRFIPKMLLPLSMGLLLVLLRSAYLASKSAPKEIAYSVLVSRLQRGLVDVVAFEEDSPNIYFNMGTQDNGRVAKSSGNAIGDFNSKWGYYSRLVDAAAFEGDSRRIHFSLGKHGDGSVIEPSRNSNGNSRLKLGYFARKVTGDEGFLMSLVRKKRVLYLSVSRSGSKALMNIVITLLTLWISLIPMYWFLRRMLDSSGAGAKKRRMVKQNIRFGDVEGVDTAKVELKEIVSCLKGSLDYRRLGAKLPKGVLLVGPPGTGKTLLARAVAGEAGVPFFSVSASEFVEVFVGRGAARVRDLFSEAKQFAPSIIFIDELDAVGGKRGRGFNDERDQTLNQLLTEMDGFEPNTRVIVIAATNRPEALDPALCRPGRFSRKVTVGVPDLEGRKKIVAVHLRGVPLEEDREMISSLVASLTPGFVGADLANIVNEAALLAARRGGKVVTREDVMNAIEREKFGINEKQYSPSPVSPKGGFKRLLSWISAAGRADQSDGTRGGLMGYQAWGQGAADF